MKNRKIKKFVAVLTLIVSFLTVQTLELTAMASTGMPDLTNPTIVVSNFADLQNAVDTASDGTVIGIDSVIPIDSPNVILGNEDGSKHVYIVRMNADSYLWLTQITNLTICNITLDGNSSQLTGNNPLLYVDGTLNLNDSVIQNCSGVSNGAIYVTDNGTFNATTTNFNNNSAISGAHIENYGTVTLNGCNLKNGSAQGDGGAIFNGRNVTIQNCKIVGNQAGLTGGAIHNGDSLSISQSVIYGNTAVYGYDIANNVNYTFFSNDNLADVMSLYEAEGVTPVEWRYDGPATEEELNQAGVYNANVYNPQSLMRLVFEEENGNESDEGSGGNEDEGTSGDDTESGGTSDDNTGTDDGTGDTGNTEEPGNTEDDNTTGDGENTDNSENTGNTEDDSNQEDVGSTEDGSQDDTGNTESDDNIEDSDNSENAGNQENDGSTTNPDDESGSNTEDGGNIGEDSGMTDDSNDNSDTGNQDSTTDNTDDNSNTGNQDNTTDNSNDNNNSENQDNTAGDSGDNDIPNNDSDDTSNSVTGGDVIINNDESSSIITNNNTNTTTEDNSSVSNTTDNYEDKSSTTNTTTTTNNYYTYNTPQDSNETERTNDTNRTSSTSVIEQQVQTVNGNSTSESTGVQLPDNLTLDLHGVDVIYEIVDGVPKITISNEKVIAEQAITEETAQARIQEPMAENAIDTASSAEILENGTVSVNWYEIIKMILLAAILIVVIYKPSEKKVLS